MKKIFFIAIYGALFCFLSCTKKEKSDPSPVTVAEQNANDGTTLETIPETGDGIMLRNCTGCTSCCCTLTVVGPAMATPTVGFCSSVFPGCGFPGCGCALGDGAACGGPQPTGSDAVFADLQVGVTNEDFKEWCGGGNGIPLGITNNDPGTVFYEIDCGNGVDTFSLTTLQSIILTKNNCDISLGCRYF